MGTGIRTLAVFVTAGIVAVPAGAQSVLDRAPNVTDGWTGAPGSIHFNFLHRFNQSGAPRHQVTNRPTFTFAYSPTQPLLIGVMYGTRSDIVPRVPNEWELFGRFGVLRQDAGAPLDASVAAAWNEAARSVDGEMIIARRQGALRLIASGRVLGSAFDSGDTRFALAGGGTLRLTRWIALAGDYGAIVDTDLEPAWGAGLQIAVPYTPHSISLQATNTNTATIHGASAGADEVRYGFEFTVPVALGRYFGTRVVAAPPPPPPDLDSLRIAVADSVRRELQSEFDLRLGLDAQQRAARDDSLRAARAEALRAAARADSARRRAADGRAAQTIVRASIRNLTFLPARFEIAAGTTIIWTNNDQVDHTVTAVDGSWDSGIIRPGQTWRHTFDRDGTWDFYCTPHPFMKGTIVVKRTS